MALSKALMSLTRSSDVKCKIGFEMACGSPVEPVGRRNPPRSIRQGNPPQECFPLRRSSLYGHIAKCAKNRFLVGVLGKFPALAKETSAVFLISASDRIGAFDYSGRVASEPFSKRTGARLGVAVPFEAITTQSRMPVWRSAGLFQILRVNISCRPE